MYEIANTYIYIKLSRLIIIYTYTTMLLAGLRGVVD